MHIGGAGETVEVDGMYTGGYIKPANHKENRRDRRLAKHQNGKLQVVVVARERGGRTLPAVFRSEAEAAKWIKARVATDTRIMGLRYGRAYREGLRLRVVRPCNIWYPIPRPGAAIVWWRLLPNTGNISVHSRLSLILSAIKRILSEQRTGSATIAPVAAQAPVLAPPSPPANPKCHKIPLT